MATVNDVFNTLVERQELSLRLDKSRAESLRIRLVKLFSKQKKFLTETDMDDGSSALSVSMEYDDSAGTASYFIRTKKTTATLDFEIVEGVDERNS